MGKFNIDKPNLLKVPVQNNVLFCQKDRLECLFKGPMFPQWNYLTDALHLFYKNKLYKNNEAEVDKKIRTN